MLEFTKNELKLLRSLRTPAQVQDFLNKIPINFEPDGIDRVKSPIKVLREHSAHCIEAAILGAYILSLHGYPPLLMHLKATNADYDHVIVPFKKAGFWGALSKNNHAVLRYREPIYKTPRELVISYFHEYYLEDGTKTLREYSAPLNLNTFEAGWEQEEEDLWGIDQELDRVKHFKILPAKHIRNLRKADPIERKVLDLLEFK